jgi:hypothetical protein
LTLRPDDLTAGDIDELRATGLTDQAIRDAAAVCALFSTITRLADTLNFAIPPTFESTVKMVTSRLGYRLPPFVLLLPRT